MEQKHLFLTGDSKQIKIEEMMELKITIWHLISWIVSDNNNNNLNVVGKLIITKYL